MSSPYGISNVAWKYVRCFAMAGGLTMLGCSSEVGSAPSGREEIKKNFQAQAAAPVNPQVLRIGRGKAPAQGQGPRSIKQRLFTSEPEK
jgi:hypothetical protein